jgi:D-alanine-D-alanine ligase
MPEISDARVAVLMGGPSAEAEVSRVSAAGVAEALATRCAEVRTLELDASCAEQLLAFAPDAVFPALHGPPGEDGTVQGMLTLLGLPYVGSDVHASAVAMDKALAKQVFRAAGLPLARELLVHRGEDPASARERIARMLGERVVVKPTRQGSALGVTLVDAPQDLENALAAALDLDAIVLVEERIEGREITVGILDELAEDGTVGRRPHPVIEIATPEGSWYDFTHRYRAGASDHLIPARLPGPILAKLQDIALRAHADLGCRDLSRADFVVGEDTIALLEVNTLPGMTPTSLYPDGAAALGLDFPELLARLVENALRRGPDLALGPAAGD